MKLTLALATMLAFVVILTVGIPVCGQMDQHVRPIPNWQEPQSKTPTNLIYHQIHMCVIVEDSGAGYKYVEGVAPGVTAPPKQFMDSDIHKVIAAGGWVKILKHGYSNDDLARERKGCLEGSSTIVLPPAKKP